MDYMKSPMGIEKRSFEIIGSEMHEHNFSEEELQIVKRVIHTTADFEYQDLIEISEGAIEAGVSALKNGAKIYTDTTMALSGMNKRALKELNASVECYVGLEEVFKLAKEKEITRSMAGVELAAKENVDIFIKEGKANPKLIVAVPVGFVGASESKEDLDELGIPYIRVKGRKGGSTVAAAIINALLYMNYKRDM